jgi:hypothetical protein
MLQSLSAQSGVAPSAKMLSDAIHPYTSQHAAQAYYQVWNQ